MSETESPAVAATTETDQHSLGTKKKITKSPPKLLTRTGAGFDSITTKEATDKNLAVRFGSSYQSYIDNPELFFDHLSVRELRVILRNLKKISTSDTTQRKPHLCKLLSEYFAEDATKQYFEQYKASKEAEQTPVKPPKASKMKTYTQKPFDISTAYDSMERIEDFFDDIQDRLVELERAASILYVRASELHK